MSCKINMLDHVFYAGGKLAFNVGGCGGWLSLLGMLLMLIVSRGRKFFAEKKMGVAFPLFARI